MYESVYGWHYRKCYIYQSNSNTTFNSCTFRNNQGANGGAVYVGASDENKTGIATFNNCTFQSNSINPSSGYGGAIYIESNGNSAVVITGTTTISSNTAKTGGGGIYKLGPLTVSGTLKVTGNTSGGATNNVQFGSNTTMSIAAAGLLCGSSIGVTKTSATNIATGSAANCSNADRNHYFFSDPGTYHVATSTTSPFYNSSSGTLYLVANATYNSWHNSAAATGCTTRFDIDNHILYLVKTRLKLAVVRALGAHCFFGNRFREQGFNLTRGKADVLDFLRDIL